jgi:hypothetical protein
LSIHNIASWIFNVSRFSSEKMLCNKKAAVQDFVRGHVEVSEVRQVQIAAPVPNFPVVTLICIWTLKTYANQQKQPKNGKFVGAAGRI